MRKFLVSAIALAALAGAPATAADLSMPYRAAPPVYFSWTGCYFGGNVGGLWINRDFTDQLVRDPFFGQTFNSNSSTWLGGVQAGCNYQFAGGTVVGIQGDYDWTGNSSNANNLFFFNNVTTNFRTKSLASVTGRVGRAYDRFLVYVKGGAAWERDDFTFTFPTGGVATLNNNTRTGWTVGVGGEYAFTNWLTGFIEYDYYGFGNNADNFVCGPVACAFTTFPVERKENKSVVKAGLNFLWGGGSY